MPIVPPLTAGFDLSIEKQNTREAEQSKTTLKLRRIVEFAEGTGSKQVNKAWYSGRLTVTNAGQNIDLSNLTDETGTVMSFTNIKGIAIKVLSTEAGKTLTVGNAGTDPFVGAFGAAAHTLTVGPDGEILILNPQTGYAVGGTSDQLRVVGVTGGTEFEMSIIGS